MVRAAFEGLRVKRVLALPVVVAAALIGGLLLWAAVSSVPDEVSLDQAVSQVRDQTSGASSPDDGSDPVIAGGDDAASADAASGGSSPHGEVGAGADAAAVTTADDASAEACVPAGSDGEAPARIAGVWNVDTSTSMGSYDDERESGSFAGFRVDEVLASGASTAVGRTGELAGTLTLTEGELTAAEVVVAMRTISTDRYVRDGKVHAALKTDEFPEAVFRLVSPVCLPVGTADGEDLSTQAVGDLTLAGVTKKAVFDLEARLVDDVIVVVGSSKVTFDDYDIKTPTAPILVSIEDHGIIELQLFFTRELG